MADSVYLSCWLRGFTSHNMLRYLDKALRPFPFSTLSPAVTVRVLAVDLAEPPLIERHFDSIESPADIVNVCREFGGEDCAYQVEGSWNLWQFEEEWKLSASPVTIELYGPLFPSELGEQLRMHLGLDYLFLPGEHRNLTALQSNVRSVLHLVDDLRQALPLDKLSLWSDSGENLAERLAEAVR